MTTLIMIAVLACIAALAWAGGRLLVQVLVPPEVMGLAYIKQQLKLRGVEPSRIPDSALAEIVIQDLVTARALSNLDIEPGHKNWRRTFNDYLGMEANAIASILAGERGEGVKDVVAWKVLSSHGILARADATESRT